MEVIKYNDYTIIFKYNVQNDQPNVVYFYGKNRAVLVDAGPSTNFSNKVLEYLRVNKLRKPDYVIITHYHWDHTFGMKGYFSQCICSTYTNERLKEFKKIDFVNDNYISDNLINEFSEEHLNIEYPDLSKIEIIEANLIIDSNYVIDLGNIEITIQPIISSHTEGSLVVLCNEILIIGDASCAYIKGKEFIENISLLKEFLNQVKKTDCSIIIEGHSDPYTKEDFIFEIENVIKVLEK